MRSQVRTLIAEFGHTAGLASPQPSDNAATFKSLCKTICYQQLAGKAAATIWARVEAACVGDFTTANLLATPETALGPSPGAGLSRAKLVGMRSLAEAFEKKPVDFAWWQLTHAELLEEKGDIKGVGPWTVNMYCMFEKHDPDLFAVGDLGLRRGVATLAGKPFKAFDKADDLGTRAALDACTGPWSPYRTVAAFYLYRIAKRKGLSEVVREALGV